MQITPKFPHGEHSYWDKPISTMLDFELQQVYENLVAAELKREQAEPMLLKRNLKLPPINPNYKILKDAIIEELKKRNIDYDAPE